MNNRRAFVKTIGATALLAATGRLSAKDDISASFSETGNKISYDAQTGESHFSPTRILPNGLKKGDTIGIVSPASPVSAWNLSTAVNTLNKLGYKVEIGPIAKNQKNEHRYFAASDEERAAELMDYFKREDIAAILTGRGGYGVMRILHKLDYDVIKANPKIIMGFSDITALLNAIYKQTGLVTYHGPVASTSFDAFTVQNMNAVLVKDAFSMEYSVNIPEMSVINKGIAEGFIQCGNLRMIASTMGTPYEIDTTDSILFLEDVSEHAYEIDRMLTQLLIAGKLDKCKGVVFGNFKNLNVRKSFFPNRAMTIAEVINEIFKPMNIPVAIGFPFGHTTSKMTLPIGIMASINTATKQFKILEKAVV